MSKDVWDVTFPSPNPGDIMLWSSENYSIRAPEDFLLKKFYKKYYPTEEEFEDAIEAEKQKLKDERFAAWQTDWYDWDRWADADDDLVNVIDKFDAAGESYASCLVFGIVKGWSYEGEGHKYMCFGSDNTAELLDKLRKKFIPAEIPKDEIYEICLPHDGTLTFLYLKDIVVDDDENPILDASGSEMFEIGTSIEFYVVKKSFINLFTNLRRADLSKGKCRTPGLNKFSENCISTKGKKAFIDTYLLPLRDSVKAVMHDKELPSSWAFN